MKDSEKYLPGTVLAVRTNSVFGWWIRLGSALRDQPNLDNHIVMADHYDCGTLWGIEGRPGGVGWVDCTAYLEGPNAAYTISNRLQAIPTATRDKLTETCRAVIGTKYDWPAIAADALNDLHLPAAWADRETWGPKSPGHVVCSSLDAWAYWKNQQDGPYGSAKLAASVRSVGRELPLIQPSDWVDWMIRLNLAG